MIRVNGASPPLTLAAVPEEGDEGEDQFGHDQDHDDEFEPERAVGVLQLHEGGGRGGDEGQLPVQRLGPLDQFVFVLQAA